MTVLEKEIITHIRKDNLNRIIEFKTNKGNIYNFEMAKEAITYDKIKNAKIVKKSNGRTLIENVDSSHSLDDFPEF